MPVTVFAVAVTVPAFADSSPDLPDRSAQEVLELVADSVDATYSGTVEQTSEFGLPELPAMGPGSSSGSSDSSVGTALELLTGSHTARVYIGADQTARFQLMDTLAQRDVIVNGSDVWLYSSQDNEAVHVLLPSDVASPPASAALPPEVPATPAALAATLLETIEPSTTIEVGETARVAGRSVYTLTLTPDSGAADSGAAGSGSPATLVDSVVLSVDAETGLPLAVTVAATGQDTPAFAVEFSSITFEAPDSTLFAFDPPADATVTEKDLTAADGDHSATPGTGELDGMDVTGEAIPESAVPTVLGEGWSSILVIPAEALGAAGPAGAAPSDASDGTEAGEGMGESAEAAQLLDQLTTAVPEGRLFESALVSVLLSADGRVFVGAVSGEQLQAAAQSTP
ncbi:LolA family protein [Glaciihabitans tibetensis]|uniref:LolA family protein n=1 Tax=Glaciihabitans tibetensis TaxID=1266600 RepID=UPI000D04DA70|nr:hypothetical protein [Glaciihabitans tibetensis]